MKKPVLKTKPKSVPQDLRREDLFEKKKRPTSPQFTKIAWHVENLVDTTPLLRMDGEMMVQAQNCMSKDFIFPQPFQIRLAGPFLSPEPVGGSKCLAVGAVDHSYSAHGFVYYSNIMAKIIGFRSPKRDFRVR